jgi:minor histocompatibility antigen H13
VIVSIGLVAYDVFFVFGSEVMMTVAKGFDVPMKLLFPMTLPNGTSGFGMLGIGDIIIPGLIVSFALRIDFIRELQIDALRRKKNESEGTTEEKLVGESKSRFYFKTSLLGFNAGYLLTLVVMSATELA